MINKGTRHLFLGYTQRYQNEDIDTMKEHINIDQICGEVIWGKFTKNQSNKQFEQGKIKVLDKQVKNNIPTFVFFCSDTVDDKQELYCADYISQYPRKGIDKVDFKLIPSYYHNKVNSDPIPNELTCQSYVRVRNIRKIDLSELENMYQFEEPFYSVKKMNEISAQPKNVLYINLEQELLNKCLESFNSYSEEYDDFNEVSLDNERLKISEDEAEYNLDSSLNLDHIFVNLPEKSIDTKDRKTKKDRNPQKNNYIEKATKDKIVGDKGELFVIKVEKERLKRLGIKNYKNKVKHVSKDKGDGLGYDILSVDKDLYGNEIPIYIEVKTTTNKSKKCPFFISKTEVEVSQEKGLNYWLYRVYNFDLEKGCGKIYVNKGNILDGFSCTVETYRAKR